MNWCFWIVVLEKTLESPLDCKEIQPVHPKGDQSWVFIGRADVEAETSIIWPPDVKSGLIWKYPDAGKDWGQEEKGTTEDEMVGWHHRLNRHEFGWTPGVGDGPGGLACCSSWGLKESDVTERLNWIELIWGKTQNLHTKWIFTNTNRDHWFRLLKCWVWIIQDKTGSILSTNPSTHTARNDTIRLTMLGCHQKLSFHMWLFTLVTTVWDFAFGDVYSFEPFLFCVHLPHQ